ncbi:MAG: GNAT family N-acetyltransferase [Clostridia bacterium]|nr:GNAT family N-acetyltransferase [Clostridia bacterium]MBR2288016.1 GNAT family N-acetyltransferase [Clostridia bacterium]
MPHERKVYFAGSIRAGRQDAVRYHEMIRCLKRHAHVLTEHVGDLALQETSADRDIYAQDIAWLREAELVIAECSCPSTGVGYELAYAQWLGIPVHVLYDARRGALSAMLTGNPYMRIHPYASEEEIPEILEGILTESFGKTDLCEEAHCMETARLVLRRWREEDAQDLYRYACDPDVGPIAGWPPHRDEGESLEVIRSVFCAKEAYAVCLKENRRAIGAIELKLHGHSDLTEADDECELGYWLGKPFWGCGLMPEAGREMIRHAFEDLGMQKIWCGYYEGNDKSKRVQEKLGFRFQWRSEGVEVPLMHEERTGYVSLITRADWEAGKQENK